MTKKLLGIDEERQKYLNDGSNWNLIDDEQRYLSRLLTIYRQGYFSDMVAYGSTNDLLVPINPYGIAAQYATSSTPNSFAGLRKNASATFLRRQWNIKMRWKTISGGGSVNCRHYYGFNSKTSSYVSTTKAIEDNELGVMIGFIEGDTNYKIYNNDGTGVQVVTDTGVAVLGSIPRTFELVFDDSVPNCKWSIFPDNEIGQLATGTITTRLPAQTTSLGTFFHVENPAGVQNVYLFYALLGLRIRGTI